MSTSALNTQTVWIILLNSYISMQCFPEAALNLTRTHAGLQIRPEARILLCPYSFPANMTRSSSPPPPPSNTHTSWFGESSGQKKKSLSSHTVQQLICWDHVPALLSHKYIYNIYTFFPVGLDCDPHSLSGHKFLNLSSIACSL